MPTRYDNMIIFGDSLSDIGIKWKQGMGRFAKRIGMMTVNPTGRFSDCRNWTDYLYESGTGQTLVVGDSTETRNRSRPHKSFNVDSLCLGGWQNQFRYANYAEGGACGSSPQGLVNKMALGTFKDQAKQFAKDILSVPVRGQSFLIFVWFGCNDLYTDGRKANNMPAVAYKIMERRAEIIQTLNNAGVNTQGDNVRFVFMGIGLPTSAARYKLQLLRAEQDFQNNRTNKVFSGVRQFFSGMTKQQMVRKVYDARLEALSQLAIGAVLFNDTLERLVRAPDIYVDMQRHLTDTAITAMMNHYGVLDEVEPAILKDIHINARDYDDFLSTHNVRVPISTSDEAHPTDRVYKYMWIDAIKPALVAQGCQFGNML